MAARTTKIEITWRERINIGNIITRLQKHLDGTIELSATQLRAAEILLKKSLPDLSYSETKTETTITHKITPELLSAAKQELSRIAEKLKEK